jgi:ribosomal protein L29
MVCFIKRKKYVINLSVKQMQTSIENKYKTFTMIQSYKYSINTYIEFILFIFIVILFDLLLFVLFDFRHQCRVHHVYMASPERLVKVQKSMAHIKTVLGERYRAYKGSSK